MGPFEEARSRGGNIARTVRAAGQMPIAPPARSARPASAPTDEFNRPIPTGWPLPWLPRAVQRLRWSVLDEDLLDGGIEMICRGLVLARRGRRSEEPSRGYVAPRARGSGGRAKPKQAVEANTTYESGCVRKRPSRSCAEQVGRAGEVRAELVLLRKALEAADRRATLMEEEAMAEREGKKAAEAEVLKTNEDTMVLIGRVSTLPFGKPKCSTEALPFRSI
ncbi:hypothetical protein ACSQ67_003169 [Phaseolus vulgaris]